MMNSYRYRGVIFDLDGTLMTSSLDFEAMRNDIGCPQNMDILAFIDAMSCQQQQRSAINCIIEHELQDARDAQIIDGVLDTLAQFANSDIPMAIVTRNCRTASELKVKTGKLPISYILSREDAPAKPNPTALKMVAEAWQLPVEQCIYVGDYLYDLQAAANAGMASCLYAPSSLPDYHHQATWVIDEFRHLTKIVLG